MSEPVYLYDEVGDWHASSCSCERHCLNCFFQLKGRQKKYCSTYCGQRYRAELALDEWLQSQTVPTS